MSTFLMSSISQSLYSDWRTNIMIVLLANCIFDKSTFENALCISEIVSKVRASKSFSPFFWTAHLIISTIYCSYLQSGSKWGVANQPSCICKKLLLFSGYVLSLEGIRTGSSRCAYSPGGKSLAISSTDRGCTSVLYLSKVYRLWN